MAAELEVLIELGFVVHTPIFEELVVLESEDRLAWGKCSAAALDIPNAEDRDGIDAETLPQGVHQTADRIEGLRHPFQSAIARRQLVDEIRLETGAGENRIVLIEGTRGRHR